jgi:disulfide bond formation protein DsbB
MTSTRPPFAALFVICAGLLAIALYLQEQVGLEPCPMCILQRYAFTAIGLVALAGAIQGPRGRGLKAYGAVLIVLALAGAGVAARQSYIQHFPPKVSSCGTDLDFLVNTFPISQALPKIFAGSGDCSEVKWRLLGLSVAEWALVWFILIVIGSAWLAFRRRAAR